MKSTLLIASAFILVVNGTSQAQVGPIDFEAAGHGADWTWTVFENEVNPPVEILGNPDASGINTSATVAKFTALQAGQPWAGCESMHGSDIGTFTLNSSNCTVKLMVYKPVISNVGVKFATASGEAEVEILVANTLINQWEELTFDFSARIGNPPSTDIDQIIFFPDFNLDGRTQDNIVYFDNITFSEQIIPEGPEVAAPTPTFDAAGVISLFSNAYTNVNVDTWSAAWDVADVQDTQVEGDDVKLYTGLSYAGIEFTSQTIDATDMTHFHMNIWTSDPTGNPAQFNIKLVDFGANGVWDGGGDDVEHELSFTDSSTPQLVSNEWITFALSLSDFAGMVTQGHVAQLVIGGDPDNVYVDNVLFFNDDTAVESAPLAPASYTLGQNYPNPFNPSTTIEFTLGAAAFVSLDVYNLGGRLVNKLHEGVMQAGTHSMPWAGMDHENQALASGVYFYQLSLDGEPVQTKRMLMLK